MLQKVPHMGKLQNILTRSNNSVGKDAQVCDFSLMGNQSYFPLMGNDVPLMGIQFPLMGNKNEFPLMGIHFPLMGNEFPLMGNEFPLMGNDFLSH